MLHNGRAPSDVVYPSLPLPQGPTPPLSGALACVEEGSYRLSSGPADGAWAVRTAYTSTCLVTPQPDLKVGLLGVQSETDHPRSILIGRPRPVPFDL